MKDFDYLVVAGPTASGKSSLALKLAKELSGHIINCDSVQVYRDFDIGSAKPTLEERSAVSHHLFDIVDGGEEFDAARYKKLCEETIQLVKDRGNLPIVVGGTGLYLRALLGQDFHDLPKDQALRDKLKNYSTEELLRIVKEKNPERLSQIHVNDRFRLERAAELSLLLKEPLADIHQTNVSTARSNPFVIYLKVPRPQLHKRIALRVDAMIEDGLIEETRRLYHQYGKCKPLQSIGYKQVVDYLEGNLTLEDLPEKIVVATRQYAKRQETWFKKTPIDFSFSNPSDYDPLKSQLVPDPLA